VNQRWSRSELGVVNAVRSELGSESRIGPGEVRGRSGLLVLARDSVDELDVSIVLRWQEMQLTSSRLAWASDLRKPCLTR
jgi:hypothetical protein